MPDDLRPTAETAPHPVPGRHDMYHVIHKGLRYGHARLIQRLGSADHADPADSAAALAELRAFLALGEGHLDGEEREIHPAVEARAPGASAHAHEGHDDHERAFAELAALAAALDGAAGADRIALGRDLYRRFGLFAAADLAHMHEEETALLGTMHRLFTDDELAAIEARIVGRIDPAKMTGYMRLIVPALTPAERAGMLGGLRAVMPPEAFAALWDGAVRPTLPPGALAALAAQLRMPRG